MTAPRRKPRVVRLDRTGRGWAVIESVPDDPVGIRELDRLMARIAGGDQEAFARFYDLIHRSVFGLVLRVLRNAVMSEEVSQEVFFEVWRKAPRFDRQRGTARAWIMTIAHRRAVDRVRSEERHSRPRPPAETEAFDVVAESVETNLDQRRVQKALEQLTPVQREVVELAYYSGHTYREVAEKLGIPLGTMKTRMRDGLKRLRTALEGSA